MVLPTRRALRTEATREAILGAVRRLVAERGITGASVKDIAREAGVAIQTIYDLFGSKGGAVFGLVGMLERQADIPPLESLAAIEDPLELLRTLAGIRRRLLERCIDVFRAARLSTVSDPDLAAASNEGRRRHEAGVRAVVGRLQKLRALRHGITAKRATDIVEALIVDESWEVLVEHRGWSPQAYEDWLTGTLVAALLEPKRSRKRRR